MALTKREIDILAMFNMSSANAFNLVMSKILLLRKGSTPYQMTKLKAFADDKINVT